MKKIILSVLISAFVFAKTDAQIPNAGFETWQSVSSYAVPTGWDNLNAMTSPLSIYTCTKGTPGNPGVSYLKLVSKNVSGMGVVPGIATTGTINTSNMSVNGGFSYSQRPQSLTGAWQYMPYGSDSSMILVYLTKWNTAMNMRDTVAIINKSLTGMVMAWANFSLDFTYLNGETPDTAQIILSSSGMGPVANSFLYIDNLAFTGSVAGIKSTGFANYKLQLFPNPVSDKLTIHIEGKNGANAQIQIFDVLGKKIKTTSVENLNTPYLLDVSELSKGQYIIKVINDNEIVTSSFLKQ